MIFRDLAWLLVYLIHESDMKVQCDFQVAEVVVGVESSKLGKIRSNRCQAMRYNHESQISGMDL